MTRRGSRHSRISLPHQSEPDVLRSNGKKKEIRSEKICRNVPGTGRVELGPRLGPVRV
jgi:hypothetical protein